MQLKSILTIHYVKRYFPPFISVTNANYIFFFKKNTDAQWSKKITVNPLASKPCLLALTNKAGDLCFWNLTSATLEHLDTITPHKSFVNLVQWSNWKKGVEPNTCTYKKKKEKGNGFVF